MRRGKATTAGSGAGACRLCGLGGRTRSIGLNTVAKGLLNGRQGRRPVAAAGKRRGPAPRLGGWAALLRFGMMRRGKATTAGSGAGACRRCGLGACAKVRPERGSKRDSQGPVALERVRAAPAVPRRWGKKPGGEGVQPNRAVPRVRKRPVAWKRFRFAPTSLNTNPDAPPKAPLPQASSVARQLPPPEATAKQSPLQGESFPHDIGRYPQMRLPIARMPLRAPCADDIAGTGRALSNAILLSLSSLVSAAMLVIASRATRPPASPLRAF